MLLLSLLTVLGCRTPSATELNTALTASHWRAHPGADVLNAEIKAELLQAWSQRSPDYTPRTHHLNEDGQPLFVNRLFLETSPYLQQHAHNPVNWYPWGDEAFNEATRLGRPVLLSVGYSTCHWCHVMEEESFEDLEIAQYINEHYIAIKVDREERPDVDSVYMTAVQAIAGRGGWPMTVWLTPDRQPFFGGTYFPARDGDRGTRTGFFTIVQELNETYHAQPDRISETAADLTRRIQRAMMPSSSGTMPDEEVLTQASMHYRDLFDSINGGTRGIPKFPSELPIRFLLREHRRTGDESLLNMATFSLQKMANGGMYDQIGGGFHRYATDANWLVPHFEKMLYDNAQLATIYLEAWQATTDVEFARIATDILDYVSLEMTDPAGGFYSATDADSLNPRGEREEGWFFTWTPDELIAVLGKDRANTAMAWFSVTPSGNFEGRSILHAPRDGQTVAEELGLTPQELDDTIQTIRRDLYQSRALRPPPLRDDKVLVGWNGLMISAFAKGSLVLNNPEWTQQATDAANFILSNLVVDGRLMRSYKDGLAKNAAMIEDYAFFIAGLIDLFEATGDRQWLVHAQTLDADVLQYYEDENSGGWWRTPSDGESLLAREKPDYDGAIPTGGSVHTHNLLRLYALTSNPQYLQRADHSLHAIGGILSRRAPALSSLLLALDWRLDDTKEVVIVTPNSREEAHEMLNVIQNIGVSNHVLVVVPEAEVEELTTLVPIVAQKTALGGATAYVCTQGACQQPTTDPTQLTALLTPQ